jgi:hypothetical protein
MQTVEQFAAVEPHRIVEPLIVQSLIERDGVTPQCIGPNGNLFIAPYLNPLGPQQRPQRVQSLAQRIPRPSRV